MSVSSFQRPSGAGWLNHPLAATGLVLAGLFTALLIGRFGWSAALGVLALPPAIWGGYLLFARPERAVYAALVLSFLLSGLTRYFPIPWGLGVDLILFLGLLGWLSKQMRQADWSPLRNDITGLALLWFAYVIFELLNPLSPGLAPWFYAMRGHGFYQLAGFVLVFACCRRPGHLDRFLRLVIWLSVAGALWGLRQQVFGTDAAEDHWLWVDHHHEEHVLFGKLRVFSFYSDAGQFGASQAMFALLCGILAISPGKPRNRLFYLAVALLTFAGFLISGTRGALAVPAAGALIYMIISRNFKILIAGALLIALSFSILKYTYLFHGVDEVRRLRTALEADNPSLQARLRNQATLAAYLHNKPFGGGIGSAGFWGMRFAPNTLLAQTPTDSYYVKIWAETGIVGLCLHLFILGYFLGKGGSIVWRLRHPALRYKVMALYSGYGGILLASYGNQVFSQLPTGMIMGVALPMIFLAPEYEQILMREQAALAAGSTKPTSI